MALRSINPFTGQVLRVFEEISDQEGNEILEGSAIAFETWKNTGNEHRRLLMEKTASLLRENIKEYSAGITCEMGKPLKESEAEIEKCAWVCDYYAQNAESLLKTEYIRTDADISYVSFEPLGTILGIMPWNFPFWQVFRFAVPTLMAGNTVLLKHASNVQICAGNIEKIFTEAGFPTGVFRNLVLGSERIEKIIIHESVKGVSLTGSEFAGQKVAVAAGNALKKCVLELGGSNAFIVLNNADLQKAADSGINARFLNAGQSCISAKRFILEREASDKFMELFLERISRLKSGDPSSSETEMGPLCSLEQAEKIEEQVNRSVGMGALVIKGGNREKAYYEPTVVGNVRPGMPLFDEEVFGPVAAVSVVNNSDEAIDLANNTRYGLGVSIFTNDIKKASEMVTKFPDGSVFINGLVKSDPRLPFGGTRRSGYGRELSGYGIREFVNIKTVWIKK
jgi:succinate-semialdehyde dehydrogenase / glutarate-semialdehyde dehydrogenase